MYEVYHLLERSVDGFRYIRLRELFHERASV